MFALLAMSRGAYGLTTFLVGLVLGIVLGMALLSIALGRRPFGGCSWAVLLLVFMSFAPGCAHRAPNLRPKPPDNVEAHLDAFPRITIAGRVVTLHAWLQDPGDVVGCPSLEWIYPDETRSFRAFDCEEEEPFAGKSETRRVRVWRGDQHFRVTFASAGHAWSAERTVSVQ